MKYLKNSPLQCQKLESRMALFGIEFLRPLRDVKTRWNSTLHMISRALYLERGINDMIKHEKEFKWFRDQITEDDWKKFRDLEGLLKPYATATSRLSGSQHTTISMVVPTLDFLNRQLDAANANSGLSGGLRDVSKAIRNKLDGYARLLRTPEALVATILDPRFKIAHFSPKPLEAEKMLDLLKKLYNDNKSQHEATQDPSEAPPDDIFPNIQQQTDEVALYLAYPIDNKADPITFWVHHANSLPVLSKLALEAFVTPATSVPSEQAFSVGNDLVTKKRNRLSCKTVRSSMLVQSWLPLIEKYNSKAFETP